MNTTEQTIKTLALLDSGARDTFVNFRFTMKHRLQLRKLLRPMKVNNADGTPNE